MKDTYIYLLPYLMYMPQLALLVSVLAGFAYVKRSSPFAYKLLFALVLLSVPVILIADWSRLRNINNHLLYLLFGPVECMLILWTFYSISAAPVIRRINKWLLVSIPFLAGLGLYMQLAFSWNDSYTMCLYNIPELIGGLSIIAEGLLIKEDVSSFSRPMIWTAFGVVFFTTVSILTLCTWRYIYSKMPLFFWTMNWLENTVQYASMAVTFILLRPRRSPGD